VAAPRSPRPLVPPTVPVAPDARQRPPRNPLSLAGHADRFRDTLSTPEGLAQSGLTEAQLAELAAATDAIRTTQEARADAERALRTAVVAAREAHRRGEALYRALRQQATRHTAMTDAPCKRAGLNVRDREPSPGLLPEITDLTACPLPQGATRLDWTGPSGGALRCEVFTREGVEGPWVMVGSASATKFVHEGAGAGVRRYYCVEPCRGTRRGDPSNIAAVY